MRPRRAITWPVLAALALALGCAASAKDSSKDSKNKAPAAAPTNSEVVATIGDKPVTLQEVDEKGQALNLKAYQGLYDARKAALDVMVADRLLEAEATSRGITKEALLEQEVTSKVKPITDADVSKFYEENKGRMQGQTLEQSKDKIQAYLMSQQGAAAMTMYLDSLKAKTPVKVMLDAPRVAVRTSKDEPTKGAPNATVEIVEYSDFQCPFCSRANATVQKLMTDYDGKVRLVFRDFPLPFHQNAQMAAEAGQCAHEQGKFWDMHDKMFANQQALAVENLKQYATELSLDTAKFNACLDAQRFKSQVDADHEGGSQMGVSGTPAFFINGRFLSGAQPYEAFTAIINDELGKTR